MDSRDEIVLAWARSHYDDADSTFAQFRNYYEREMVKEVERKTRMAEIRCQEVVTGRTKWRRLPNKTKGENMDNDLGRPVLVTTEYRGVFFGYATDTSGDTIQLRRARNCIYWPASNKGVLGLASDGPQDGARVGPPADVELRKVTAVAEVTPAAMKRWEDAPW